mmetsp:Transcript_86449/g.242022  ORF Transcript_86449/g.242022 Transcript_86449/m.242022 type:complete len:357 (-) Transcript_86449:48-1118(-)
MVMDEERVFQPSKKKRLTPQPGQSARNARLLVILDMNGVLLFRNSKRDDGLMRPHLEDFLSTLFEELEDKVQVAVWSSMMQHNLMPLVYKAFGSWADRLQFVWDQSCCTQKWVPQLHKPLLRKDLMWLRQTAWAACVPDFVLLVDDDPIKCTENPKGTAVHPSSFKKGEDDASWETVLAEDTELLRLAAYVKAIVASGTPSPRRYVLQHPFEAFELEESEKVSAAVAADEAAVQLPLKIGDAVEAYWPDEDRWHRATVTKVLRSSGLVSISWDEDGSESDVTREYIRVPRPRNPWVRMSSRSKPGCYYYYNSDTGESQLEPPPPWEIVQPLGKEGEYYYLNAETGKKSFSKPDLSD